MAGGGQKMKKQLVSTMVKFTRSSIEKEKNKGNQLYVVRLRQTRTLRLREQRELPYGCGGSHQRCPRWLELLTVVEQF